MLTRVKNGVPPLCTFVGFVLRMLEGATFFLVMIEGSIPRRLGWLVSSRSSRKSRCIRAKVEVHDLSFVKCP